jgi:hypothetical protein
MKMKQETPVLEKLAEMLEKGRAENGNCHVQEEAVLVSTRKPAKYCSSDPLKCPYKGDKKGFVGKDRFGHVSIDMNHLCGYDGETAAGEAAD